MNIPTITTLDELIDVLEEAKYNYYGLRAAYPNDIKNIDRGYLDQSRNWIDGSYTDEKIPGTCAISVGDYLSDSEILKRYNRVRRMYLPATGTNTILLIADNYMEYGEDEDEIIIGSYNAGADIVAIIDI